MQPNTYELKAPTDIWTGDCAGHPSRLVTTGSPGSIRWWCEVIVRGLGGRACDLSNAQARCSDCQGRWCVVCERFACTSQARQFRFDVRDDNVRIPVKLARRFSGKLATLSGDVRPRQSAAPPGLPVSPSRPSAALLSASQWSSVSFSSELASSLPLTSAMKNRARDHRSPDVVRRGLALEDEQDPQTLPSSITD
jgi:hypothetical protein